MRPCNSLKLEFLKNWIMGLQRWSFSKKEMGILERKKAIKLSADIAMASARNGTTRWSRALIANAYSKHDKHLVSKGASTEYSRRIRSKKILKRSCRRIRRRSKGLVRERTRILKNLIPGGELMNEGSLIEESLDYIVSLRAQVDVMRSLVSASEVDR
ncbi:hypothetical protein F3Y22_tig00002880pilonHSYRG00107 [Hibiscus syriacus]|uniref:IBH1-like N-terminal domain-containing protein n=1 Tax=Hibiscus syriacus TaxID=106335 RepID=A0A6A3CMV7_HIBSY|nr:transcription factor IBH1-like 1 [Hibiscus syriacus]KAE8730795.1 hypothetical protein F3Y22_tig00002880pilonHSYRG00107 [Hibiscus syriacus]